MNFEKRANSLRIWYANSRVWHRMMMDTSPSTGSLCDVSSDPKIREGMTHICCRQASDEHGRLTHTILG